MRQLNFTFSENFFIENKEYRPLNLLGRAYKHIRTFINDAVCQGYEQGKPTETRFFESEEIRDLEFISFYHDKVEIKINGVKYFGLKDKNILDNLKENDKIC